MNVTNTPIADVAKLRAAVAHRGRWLQYVTIAWNSLECLAALVAGFLAGSIALVGFGFDSAIEVMSSLAALWRLRWDADEAWREAAERHTLRIIGACFLLLAAYVSYDATRALLERWAPEQSTIGIVIAALSLIVMPLLVHFKRRIASSLGSGALEAEARQTRICAYLSAILLAGLGLNAWLGWWCRSSPGKVRRRFAAGRAATDRAGDGLQRTPARITQAARSRRLLSNSSRVISPRAYRLRRTSSARSPARRRRLSSHQMAAATAPTNKSQPMAISNIIPLMPDPIMVGFLRVQRKCHRHWLDRRWLAL